MIFDWHLDLAWNALEWDRDLTRPVAEIRTRELEMNRIGPGRGTNTVSFPALRAGNVALVSATLLARHDRVPPPFPDLPKSGFGTSEASYASAVGQLAYYRCLERRGVARIIRDRVALDDHVARWEAHLATGPDAVPPEEAPPIGLVISMEGADPILAPEDLDEWWDAGLRIISLSHFGNSRYSHGTGTPGPLTPLGPALLAAMDRLGMILDVTHLADEAMDQAFDLFPGTILASHHNCRALVDRQRQLRDADIRRIAARGGVIGAALDAWMLDIDCRQGSTTPEHTATLESVADQIDHVCQLTGSSRHAALGTDLDGGFGTEQSPHGLDTIADLARIPAVLQARGYTDADIAAILHRNWLELLRRAWKLDAADRIG